MSRIAIVAMEVKLAGERMGDTRARTLANMLAAKGHEVDLITSSFQHWEKRQRDVEHFEPVVGERFNLVFLREPGYARDIDVRRIRSHAVLAGKLSRYLKGHADGYDLIYAQMPPNDVALAAGRQAKQAGVPFVVDVCGLWPEAMRMVLDVPGLSSALFRGFSHDARETYRLASGVVGTSQEFALRPFRDRPLDIPYRIVYPGCDLEAFDEGVARFGTYIEKPHGQFWVTYAGTLSSSNDLSTLVKAVVLLEERGYRNIRVKLLGTGPAEKSLRKLVDELGAPVDFEGYQPYQKMAVFLRKSNVVINSYVRKSARSISGKVGDYYASGHPIINTCSSEELQAKIVADDVGINIESGKPDVLASAILKLYDDPVGSQDKGLRARLIAEEEFDRPRSYRKIVELVEQLLGAEQG